MFYYFQQQLREAKETIAKVETQIGDNKDTDNKIEDSNNVESESKDTLSESNDKPEPDESEEDTEDSWIRKQTSGGQSRRS